MAKGAPAPQPDPRIGEAAVMQGELGKEWLNFAKEQFKISQGRQKEIDALSRRVTETQLSEMERLGKISREDRARYESVFRPVEDRFIKEAQEYDSPERQAEESARARADVASAAAAERGASERRSFSYGIRPDSGQFAGIDRATELGTGLAKVGAENMARDRVSATGRAMRGAVIDMGRGLPASAAATSQLATATGTNAAGVNAGANSQYLASTGIMNQGFQGGLAGYRGMASGLTDLYSANLERWKSQQELAAQNAEGWGNLGGTVLGLGLSYLSSKKAKTDRKAVKEGEGLEAVDNMPVDTFRYKDGAGPDPKAEHVGPMAEDFAKATGKGDGKVINIQDMLGIQVAAVKDLSKKVTRIEEHLGIGDRTTRRAA